jgi:hypothetical protein
VSAKGFADDLQSYYGLTMLSAGETKSVSIVLNRGQAITGRLEGMDPGDNKHMTFLIEEEHDDALPWGSYWCFDSVGTGQSCCGVSKS